MSIASFYRWSAQGDKYGIKFAFGAEGYDPGAGWTKGEIAFWAYQVQEPDTVAYYRWSAQGDKYGIKFAYGPPDYDPGTGWTKGEIAFWAYQSEKAGTLAYYRWSAQGDKYGIKFAYGPPDYDPGAGWTQEEVVFWTYPAVQYKVDYEDLVYSSNTPPVKPPQVVTKQKFSNSDEKATLHSEFRFDVTKTLSFEWGLTETLNVATTLDFDVEGPFSMAGISVSVSLDLGSHQTWSSTDQYTYSYSTDITIPPKDAVTATGYFQWVEDGITPFTLHINVRANDPPVDIPGIVLAEMFSYENKKAILVRADPWNNALFSLTGSFTGSYGFSTYSEVTPG